MKAFTLLELLVVCAIVALLSAILFPVLGRAKESAKSTVCLSQEYQLGLALNLYGSDNDDGLPAGGEDESNGPGGGELNAESWTDQVQPFAGTRLIYRCPTDDSPQWEQLVDARQTSYGLNSFFAPNHPPLYGFRLGNVCQPSQCVLLAELAGSITEDHFSPMFWGDPPSCLDAIKQDVQWDPVTHKPKTIDLARHVSGSNYFFVDMHVKKMRFEQLWRQIPGRPASLNAFDPTR